MPQFALTLLFVSIAWIWGAHATPVSSEEVRQAFNDFRRIYNRTYPEGDYEFMFRMSIFSQRYEFVKAHNADSNNVMWVAGVNEFSDRTYEEFRRTRLGASGQDCSATLNSQAKRRIRALQQMSRSLPKSIDWREFGIVSPVEDQGDCGSCWTFSATGALEAHSRLYLNRSVELSQQNLIDCAHGFNNFGCNGGLPSQAFEYIRYNGGLDTLKSYPYKGIDQQCKFNSATTGVKVRGVYNVTARDEEELLYVLATAGPVSIAYDCSDAFMSYKSGVFHDSTCSKKNDQVNHAVLAVGYGTTPDGVDYYIVKNSWGSDWGEKGFFRILRGTNECGLADCASYPILEEE